VLPVRSKSWKCRLATPVDRAAYGQAAMVFEVAAAQRAAFGQHGEMVRK
jgi:hypothetical protein